MQNFESPWVSAEPTSLEFMEAPAGFIRLRQLYSYPQWQRLSCKRLQHCAICIRSRSPIWTPIADKWYRYNDLIYHVSSQHGAVLSFYWDLYLTAASIDIGKEGMQDKDNSLVTFLEGNVMRERPISSLAQWQELSGKGHQTCRLCQKCTSIIWSRFRSSWHTGDALWYHMEIEHGIGLAAYYLGFIQTVTIDLDPAAIQVDMGDSDDDDEEISSSLSGFSSEEGDEDSGDLGFEDAQDFDE